MTVPEAIALGQKMYPGLRAGQLIYIALASSDGKLESGDGNLFYITDETFALKLVAYARRFEQKERTNG